jgi:hypothetical protein
VPLVDAAIPVASYGCFGHLMVILVISSANILLLLFASLSMAKKNNILEAMTNYSFTIGLYLASVQTKTISKIIWGMIQPHSCSNVAPVRTALHRSWLTSHVYRRTRHEVSVSGFIISTLHTALLKVKTQLPSSICAIKSIIWEKSP